TAVSDRTTEFDTADTAVEEYFGTGGAGEGFANSGAIATAIGTAAAGQNAATGLQAVLAEAVALEGDVSTAQGAVN
mgnify:CR=1